MQAAALVQQSNLSLCALTVALPWTDWPSYFGLTAAPQVLPTLLLSTGIKFCLKGLGGMQYPGN